MPVRSSITAAILIAVLAACSGGADEASEPECPPTTTGAQPAGTTTVDPRCVQRAQETTGGDEAESTDQVWKGTVHQVWNGVSCKSEATSPAEFTVRGPDGRFQMTVSFTEVASDCAVPVMWGSAPLAGQLSADRLSIEGGPILTGAVPRSGDRIIGNYTNPLPNDARQTYLTTWDLKCEQGCDGGTR